MTQRLFVGDLVRPTARAAAKVQGAGMTWVYGQQFKARYPAIVVHLLEAEINDSNRCLVAYRLKNRNWKQHHNCYEFSEFELVHRPSQSALLNPFQVNRAVLMHRNVSVFLAKKYFVVFPQLDGLPFIDPDVPIVVGDRPIIPEVLGQALRSSLAAVHGYRDRFINGSYERPFLDAIKARAELALETARDQISDKYKVDKDRVFLGRRNLQIGQLYDCFRLMPMAHSSSNQSREAWRYIGLESTNREFGELVLELLERPIVSVDYVAKTDPFIGRILPYLNIAAMEADLRSL